ncbi:hypothetical protein GCM10023195_38480 [Actinoallomurus liliacearum]|uniref:Uncharacterized protein n=1 Tax=Actinoallomurus liliacearum TaxID=1080073 RepID=A0ABP8TLK6_9ACTN
MGNPYYEQSWPTIEGYKEKEVVVNHDLVKKYIDALDQDRKDLIVGKDQGGKGYPDDLVNVAKQISARDVGAGGDGKKTSYPAGEVIWQSIQNVVTEFPKAYGEWVKAYKDVVDGLYDAAGFHKKAELDSKIPGTTGTQPTTPTTTNQPSATDGTDQT